MYSSGNTDVRNWVKLFESRVYGQACVMDKYGWKMWNGSHLWVIVAEKKSEIGLIMDASAASIVTIRYSGTFSGRPVVISGLLFTGGVT
jgi:hypothetical protein